MAEERLERVTRSRSREALAATLGIRSSSDLMADATAEANTRSSRASSAAKRARSWAALSWNNGSASDPARSLLIAKGREVKNAVATVEANVWTSLHQTARDGATAVLTAHMPAKRSRSGPGGSAAMMLATRPEILRFVPM